MKKPIEVKITFDDGSVETHNTSDGGFYRRVNTHREDSVIPGRIVEFWESHNIGWSEGRTSRDKQQETANNN